MRHWRGQDMDKQSNKERRGFTVIDGVAKVPLGMGAIYGYATVDIEDAERVTMSNWTLGVRGYPTTGNGKTMHHAVIGKPQKGMVTDHINRDKTDNRKANLRAVPQSVNVRNRPMNRNNTSGYRGVWKTDNNTWKAEIKVNYKKISLGTYPTPELAAAAYDRAAVKYFKSEAQPNLAANEVKV